MLIYFGLGSNLYDRLANLRSALACLETLGRVINASNVYETQPWGGVSQPAYLNACVALESNSLKSPPELLTRVKTFEQELGRVESVRWGPRKIDIDILLIDDTIHDSPELHVPHVSLSERLFVLIPLRDILPDDWRHPVSHKTLRDMIRILDDKEGEPVRVTSLI